MPAMAMLNKLGAKCKKSKSSRFRRSIRIWLVEDAITTILNNCYIDPWQDKQNTGTDGYRLLLTIWIMTRQTIIKKVKIKWQLSWSSNKVHLRVIFDKRTFSGIFKIRYHKRKDNLFVSNGLRPSTTKVLSKTAPKYIVYNCVKRAIEVVENEFVECVPFRASINCWGRDDLFALLLDKRKHIEK
jgi:hypothetical protein